MALRVERAGREAWLSVATSDPRCTFFQTPWWSEVAEATGAWVDDSLLGRFDDGTMVVLPRVRAGRRVVSGWAGCYGGPVAGRELRADEHAEILRAASAGADRASVVGSPFHGRVSDPRWQVTIDHTLAIDLAGKEDYASVRKNFSRNHKNGINGALRAGYAIGIADAEARVDEYVALDAAQTRERAQRRPPLTRRPCSTGSPPLRRGNRMPCGCGWSSSGGTWPPGCGR